MIRAALIAGSLACPAIAEDSAKVLAEAAQAELKLAYQSLEAADGARDRVAALTETVEAYEAGLQAFRAALREIVIQERAMALKFDAERGKIEQMLTVMLTMEGASAPHLLLHPSGPIGTARSGMILSDVTPALQSQAEELKLDLQEIGALRTAREDAQRVLEQGLAGAQEARARLSQAVADRTDLPKRFLDKPEALANLRDTAKTLAAFADGLSESDLGGVEDFTSMRGVLPLPVNGTLLRRFGEADAAGVRRPGILLAVRPGALVRNPHAATVRYAGPFLDYGKVIILEPAGDYLMVLAGLQEVYGQTGEVLPADAPLGVMGGNMPGAQTIVTQAVEGGGVERTETLYIEMRVGEGPVDPAQWFALNKD